MFARTARVLDNSKKRARGAIRELVREALAPPPPRTRISRSWSAEALWQIVRMVLDEFPRQLARTRRFTLGVPRAVTISADGERVLFLRSKGGEDPVTCLWLLDLASGRGEQLLADPAAAWNAGSGDVPEAERIRRERARGRAAGIVAHSADTDGRTVAFALDGQLWALSVDEEEDGQACAPRLVSTPGAVTEPRIDPTASESRTSPTGRCTWPN